LKNWTPRFPAWTIPPGRPSRCKAPTATTRRCSARSGSTTSYRRTIRSERQLVEQISLLSGWFVGLSIDDAVWNHSVFSKNRHRLVVSVEASQAGGFAERRVAAQMAGGAARAAGKRVTAAAGKVAQ